VIGVIDYGMGNLRSVLNAVEHLGGDAVLVSSPADADQAEKLILPGVGAFGVGMQNLDRLGFAEALPHLARSGRPLLGICLGMQLLASTGTEHGRHDGLGLVPGLVERIDVDGDLRIPHVGWNAIDSRRESALFEGLSQEPTFYFVHSYELRPDDPEALTATTDYGGEVTACVQADGIFGVQFHPEKSQADGLRLLENFLSV
jgi:imidazole glycerol-phosphate synthase subunit HisH